MAEVVQRVRTIFSAESRGLQGELNRLGDKLRGFQRMALAAVGVYGLGSVFKGLVSVNAAAEQSALGIATMIQAADRMRGRMTPFAAALGIAKGTLEDLRQVAVDTPATFEQVADSFKAIVFPARGAGMNMRAIAQLAGDVATLEAAEGSPGLLSRDIQQLLRGTNNVDSQFLRPYKDELMRLIRSGKQVAALNRVREIVQLDPAARAAAGNSFEGRMATFSDQVAALKRAAGEPIFAFVNEELGKMSKWLTANKAEVERIAKAVGGGLVKAFVAVKDAVAWLVESGVGKIALYVYGGVKAVGILGGAFRALMPALSLLAAHPFFLAIAGAAALVASMVAGMESLRNFKPDQAKGVAQANREQVGKVGGMAASIFQSLGLMTFGQNYDGARTLFAATVEESALSGQAVDARAAQRNALAEAQRRALAAAEASDARRRSSEETARSSAKPSRMNVNVDARGSKVTLHTRLETDDPARFADASLKGAFIGAISRPLAAVGMLGGVSLATGRSGR